MTFNEINDDVQGIILTVFNTDYHAVFTNGRIDRKTVPSGYYCYDLRDSDSSNTFCEIADSIVVNHAGCVVTKKPIDFHGDDTAHDRNFDYSFDDDVLSEFDEILSD